MLMETVDMIYPEGTGGANRIVVDVIHYRERRGTRAVSLVYCYIYHDRNSELSVCGRMLYFWSLLESCGQRGCCKISVTNVR